MAKKVLIATDCPGDVPRQSFPMLFEHQLERCERIIGQISHPTTQVSWKQFANELNQVREFMSKIMSSLQPGLIFEQMRLLKQDLRRGMHEGFEKATQFLDAIKVGWHSKSGHPFPVEFHGVLDLLRQWCFTIEIELEVQTCDRIHNSSTAAPFEAQFKSDIKNMANVKDPELQKLISTFCDVTNGVCDAVNKVDLDFAQVIDSDQVRQERLRCIEEFGIVAGFRVHEQRIQRMIAEKDTQISRSFDGLASLRGSAEQLLNEIMTKLSRQKTGVDVQFHCGLPVLSDFCLGLEGHTRVKLREFTSGWSSRQGQLPTIEALIRESTRVSTGCSSCPPDYIVYQFRLVKAGIKDAELIDFKKQLSQAISINPDSIISLEMSAGSLIIQALFPYQVTFHPVPSFNDSQGREWTSENIDHIRASPEGNALVEEMKRGQEWLSISQSQTNLHFLLSDPNVTPIEVMDGKLVDFAVVHRFLSESVEKSDLDLEVAHISVYRNTAPMNRFVDKLNPDSKLKYLFHGTPNPLVKFVETGFNEKLKGRTGQKLGQGFYATSFLDLALCYQYKTRQFTHEGIREYLGKKIRDEPKGAVDMLLLLCNLGRCQTVRSPSWDEALPDNVDSRYARVQKYDEFVFKNKYAAAPQFIVTFRFRPPGKILIWRNTSFHQFHNEPVFDMMTARFPNLPIVVYPCDDEALHRINKTQDKDNVFVMTNRADNGNRFIEKCRAAGVTTPILVYCKYACNWNPMDNVTITTHHNAIWTFLQDEVLKQ
jgi:hypothetical protein